MAGGKAKSGTRKKASTKAKSASRAKRPAKPAARSAGGARKKPTPARGRTGASPRAAPRSARTAAKASPARGKTRVGAAADFSLEKLHQVALTARDLDASVEFYRDILGLRFITRFDPPGLAFFNLGAGVRLLLSASESSATLYFVVDDLDAAFERLKKRGVHFLKPPAMLHHDEDGHFGKRGNEEWMAFFRDPSDNVLALVEKR